MTHWIPEYVIYKGNFRYTLSEGYFKSATCSFVPDNSSPGYVGKVVIVFTLPPDITLEGEFGFDLMIDAEKVPIEWYDIKNVGGGTYRWDYTVYWPQPPAIEHRTAYGNIAYYPSWPILWPNITLQPNTGMRGARVTVVGNYFTPNTNVQILFSGTQVASANVNSNGDFTTYFDVPENAEFGSNLVQPVTSDRGARNATFIVKRGYRLTLEADPPKIFSDGKSTTTITARLTDKEGQPIEGVSVHIGLDQYLGKLEGGTHVEKTTGGDGTVTVTYTAPTTEEVISYYGSYMKSISIGVSALGTVDGATASTSIKCISEYTCRVVAEPTAVAADGRSLITVTAQLLTGRGDPVQGKTVEFFSPGVLQLKDTTGTVAYAVTDAYGKAYMVYVAPTPEVYTYFFGNSPQMLVTLPISFIITENYVIKASVNVTVSKNFVLTAEANPNKLSLGDTESESTITVTLKDADGQPVRDKLVELSIEPNIGRLEVTQKKTEFDGKALVKYYSPTEEQFNMHYPDKAGHEVKITATVRDESDTIYTASANIMLQKNMR